MTESFVISCFLLVFVLFEGESENLQLQMNYYSNRNPYRAGLSYSRKMFGGQNRATVFGGPEGDTIVYGNSVKLAGSSSSYQSKPSRNKKIDNKKNSNKKSSNITSSIVSNKTNSYETIINEIITNEIGGNVTHNNETITDETSGNVIHSNETITDETSDNVTHSNETITDETSGNVTHSNETITDKTSGNVTPSNETITDEISSNETSSKLQKPLIMQNRIDTTLKLDQKVITLQAATILKDNLIKVFGYVLHRADMELESDLYTSLYFILQALKLNQVNIISMVPMLSDLSFKSSNERFLKIFEFLEEHLPEYLTCAATLWKDAIRRNEVNMNNILEPYANGPLIVDVFDKLQKEMLDKVTQQEILGPLENEEEKKIFFNFNLNIVQIMRYMNDHKKEIHQMFLGALIHFFPRNLKDPVLEESMQYLSEWLEQNEIDEWESYIKIISKEWIEDPYKIVTELLLMITENDHLDFILKNSAQMTAESLTKRNPTAINADYGSISSLVSLEKIDAEYMLNYVAFGAYPLDIVLAGVRVKFYLKEEFIRYLALFHYFNPYLYSSSMEIIIAILIRVVKQQPDLPLEITDSSGAVYSYLTFFIRYIHLPALMPDDFQNLNIIFFGLRAPDIHTSLKATFAKIVGFLQEEPFHYQNILQEVPSYKCTTPATCLMEFCMFMIKKQLASNIQQTYMSVLLTSSCYCCQCRIELLNEQNSNNSLIPPKEVTLPDLFSNTTVSLLDEITLAPTEGPIETASTAKPSPPTTPTAPPSPSKIPTGVTATLPVDSESFIQIVLEIAKSINQDEKYLKVILNEFHTKEFKEQYQELVQKKDHKVVITMIMVQLAKIEEEYKNVTDDQVASEVRRYLRRFHDSLNRMETVLEKITLEKKLDEPILSNLIVAVKAPKNYEEEKMYKNLQNLLEREDIFKEISPHLQQTSYKNMGSLLNAILTEEIKLKEKLSDTELEAATYYQDKVEFEGFGEEKVTYGANMSRIKSNVDISRTFDNAIGFKSLSKSNKKKFNHIVAYLKDFRKVLKNWDKWVLYTNSAEFTKAVLQLIQDQSNVPLKVKVAVDTLLPMVHFDGDGKKPVYIKKNKKSFKNYLR